MKSIKNKTLKKWILVFLLVLLVAFIPTPYYLYQPGPIEDLQPKVSVTDGYSYEDGSFSLTTVLSVKALNPYLLAYGLFAPHTDIVKEEEVKGNLTDREYSILLDFMMKDSQQNALVSAFKSANEQVKIDYHGIFVQSILPDSPAKSIMEIGDTITKMDGMKMKDVSSFISYIEDNKQEGDTITLTIKRDNEKEFNKTVNLMLLDQETGKVGIGIVPEEDFTATISRDVTFKSDDIGGPSAGLMFSLEIYNQLTPDNLTKGYKIAGTGTIDHDGNVGQIGGIRHKITAAVKEGADIFFTPKDLQPIDQNEHDVIEEVKEQGYEIKVVPVATLDEAIDYLNKLKKI